LLVLLAEQVESANAKPPATMLAQKNTATSSSFFIIWNSMYYFRSDFPSTLNSFPMQHHAVGLPVTPSSQAGVLIPTTASVLGTRMG
jgi:hypothetical protein